MTGQKIGWRPYVSQVVNVVDADAQAFIAAAGITDLTQAAAISTLVNDLKTYGIWSKMKALYPFVGGTATSHKFNLKDPRDLDAAYRLVFSGGWVHSNNGALPNGTTGYADSKYNPNINGQLNSAQISYYSRTNSSASNAIDIGALSAAPGNYHHMHIRYTGDLMFGLINTSSAVSISNNISQGLFISSRINSTNVSLYRNNSNIGNVSLNSTTQPNNNIYIGAGNITNSPQQYSSKESVFASIGDGLTDTEATNFYTSIQKFQTTLGRQAGTPYVSDADAVSFLNAAGITDGTQAAAINTLVTDLKTAGVWTKMKALYPFVGGSAASHKFNLKDPRDLDAAYRLVFNGGWTHASTGALPNGTTGYADTKLIPSSVMTNYNSHMSFYSRTQSLNSGVDIGSHQSANYFLQVYTAGFGGGTRSSLQRNDYDFAFYQSSSTIGHFMGQILSQSNSKIYTNGVLRNTNTTNNAISLPSINIYIGSLNINGVAGNFTNRESVFASIGDGLTDNEASAFYTAVQKYQTSLGRQVNTPLVSDSDAQVFLNAAGITSYTQANAVNTLVTDLKAAGVWSKMKAVYPFVGGSAASHKFNLKDPRDLDAAYRLNFYGGWTHSSTGALPNGTTGYANTFLNPSQRLMINNSHLSFYSRTNTTVNGVSIGSYNTIFTAPNQLILKWTDGNFYGAIDGNTTASFINGSSLGNYIASRTANNVLKAYKNNSLMVTNTTLSVVLNDRPLFIGARNEGVAMLYDNKESAFASIGDGLTDSESTAFYTAVQKFQTALGRQVGTPVYNTNGLVLNLDAGNANSYPGTGTTWFDLASGNNGTLVNGPTYDVNNGGSISFDGVNDYVVVSDTPFRFGNQFTINTWIYWDGLDKTNRAILGKRNGPSGNYNQYAMGINNGDVQYGGTGKVLFFYARVDGSTGGNDPLDVSMTYTLPSTPGIYNISVVMNSTIQKMFVNGLLVNTSTKNVSGRTYNISGVDFLVGASRDNTSTGALGFFNNKIYSVSVYGRTLTDTEVLQNFNSMRGRFGL
jgi:hypothetical protein